MELNLDKIKGFSAVTFLLVIICLTIPGFMFLYIFKKEFFLEIDNFRLCVLAISISAPLLVINGIFFFYILVGEYNDEKTFNRAVTATMFLGSLLSIPVLYSVIIVGYLFNLNLKQGVLSVAIVEVVFIIILLAILKIFNKK